MGLEPITVGWWEFCPRITFTVSAPLCRPKTPPCHSAPRLVTNIAYLLKLDLTACPRKIYDVWHNTSSRPPQPHSPPHPPQPPLLGIFSRPSVGCVCCQLQSHRQAETVSVSSLLQYNLYFISLYNADQRQAPLTKVSGAWVAIKNHHFFMRFFSWRDATVQTRWGGKKRRSEQ